MEFLSWSFFSLARSPMAERRRKYVIGRQIFLQFPMKAISTSIGTTVGASRDPARAKEVIVYPRYFYQQTRERTLPGCLQAWRSWRVLPESENMYRHAWILNRLACQNTWLLELNEYFGCKPHFNCVGSGMHITCLMKSFIPVGRHLLCVFTTKR